MLTMEGERALVILVLWIMSGRAASDDEVGDGDGGSRRRRGRGTSMDVSDMTSSRQHRSKCGGAAYVRWHA